MAPENEEQASPKNPKQRYSADQFLTKPLSPQGFIKTPVPNLIRHRPPTFCIPGRTLHIATSGPRNPGQGLRDGPSRAMPTQKKDNVRKIQ